jgi:hypothetical protein
MSVQARLVARLGLACMAATILSGIGQGLWEMAHPVLISDITFAAASAAQRWGYGILSVNEAPSQQAARYRKRGKA